MEVSQGALARMLCYCFLCGGLLGAFYDVLRLTRVPLGGLRLPLSAERLAAHLVVPKRLCPYDSRVLRSSRKEQSKRARVVPFVVTLVEDVLFFLVGAVVLVLVLYVTNDGQFRLSAVAVLVLGFVCYLVTIGRPIRFGLLIAGVVIKAAMVWLVCLVTYPLLTAIRWLGIWTAPLRGRVHCFLRCRVCRLRERIRARKQARLMCAARRRESALRLPDGRHHFSTGKGRTVEK